MNETGNPTHGGYKLHCNQYTTKTRMCERGTCRETWDYNVSGMGMKKYCKKCTIIIRAESKRRNNIKTKFKQMKVNLFKNWVMWSVPK